MRNILLAGAVCLAVYAGLVLTACTKADDSNPPSSSTQPAENRLPAPNYIPDNSKPTQEALQRAEGLRASLGSVYFVLRYHGPQNEPYYSMWLTVPRIMFKMATNQHDPFFPVVQITREQANRIIDHLLADGFFERAESYDATGTSYKGPTYTLKIAYGKGFYEEDLGWGLKMLDRLQGLRKVLDGPAAEAIEKLLARLDGHRRQWEEEASTQPATQLATRPAVALPPETLQSMKRLAGQAELIVLGKVVKIYDGTAHDGGMSYDVQIEKVFKGILEKHPLHFRSAGWVGYAKYAKGEQVLLFLRKWEGYRSEFYQLKPIVQISSSTQPGALDISAVKNYEELFVTLLAATQPLEEWGEPVNGLQSGLRFGLQARAYRMGELVDFVLLVRNTGDKTVTLVDYIPLTGWAPTVRTVDGKSLPVAVLTIGMPVQVRKSVLKPGDILEVGTVFLQLDASPEERGQTPHVHLTPGKYLVSQVYRFADNQEATWSGELTTGELTLSVAAVDKPSEIEVPATQPH